MADMVLTDEGAAAFLEAVFNDQRAAGGDDLTLRLFTNNHDPADTDIAADYTEATGGGYSARTLNMGSWTVSVESGIAQALYAVQSFVFTGPLAGNPGIWGTFITDADGTLILAQKRALAFTPQNDGDHLDVTPKIQMSKGTPT
jgi:hypothetical protein